MITSALQRLLENCPASPGIYRFKNAEGQLLYVGKAKNLKNRVRSYFRKEVNRSTRTQKLTSQIADVEWTEVASDWEALVLESQFIKEFQPKYNVLLKDDKNFVYIKITKNEAFPRIEVVRKVLKDGARYFGPKTSANHVKKTLTLLQKLFKFRSCDLDMEWLKGETMVTRKTIAYPCLDFHIKRCEGPCISKISPEEYKKNMDQVEAFLEGKTEAIEALIQQQMLTAVQEKAFEKAAQLRDRLASIKGLTQHQIVAVPELSDLDVFAFVLEKEKVYFNLFLFRSGKLISQENFVGSAPGYEAGDEALAPEVLESFLYDYYERTTDFPEGILTPIELEESELFDGWIKQKANRKLHLKVPQKGQKHELLELSQKNALSFMKQHQIRFLKNDLKITEGLQELQRVFSLTKLPQRMECFDISHLGGTQTVASMVVFENGKTKNADYRRFRLKSIEEGEIDDFKSMNEILERRLSYLKALPKDYSIKKGRKPQSNCLQIFKEAESIGNSEWQVGKEGRLTLTKLEINAEDLSECLLKGLLKTAQKSFKAKRVYVSPSELLTKERLERLGFQSIKTGNSFAMDLVELTDSSFSKKPDLLIIDGGKGQLSKAKEALDFWGLTIPMISLAKREEEIFLPNKSLPVLLSKDAPGLQMLMRLRDEAHRFAITFQRESRKKISHASILDEVPGLGAKNKSKLLKQFGSPEQIKKANLGDLQQIVGPALGEKIFKFLKG